MKKVGPILLLVPFSLFLGYVVVVFWDTRSSAVTGTYRALGSWGSATLDLRADHTFREEALTFDYLGRTRPKRSVHGEWQDEGRGLLGRRVVLRPCMRLPPNAFSTEPDPEPCGEMHTYLGLVTLSEIGIQMGADLYFFK